MSQTLAGPKGKPETWLHIEECDRAELEFTANDAFRGKAQAVRVEPHRSIKVVHTERNVRDAGLHARSLLQSSGSRSYQSKSA
jgi:hypothetical protein